MAYDKYTWQTGETITAEKLNHIEDGIENAGSGKYEIKVLSKGDWSSTDYSYKKLTGFSIDKTNGNEIREAFIQGQEVFFIIDEYNDGKSLSKFVLTDIQSAGSSSNAFGFTCMHGRYVADISLSFAKYPPTYGFNGAYANSKDLYATS